MSKIPKDRQIIIETNMGTYVAIWNEVHKTFIYANPQLDYFQGELIDSWFETEQIEEDKILKWRELR